ncbi:septum formation family protein [Nitriliruptor alkaliphilus]|uniref:septum formation family protein n=1 Tax=Nitriliruptor alkaliphilus TaxID=427918 RepID=UPI00069658F8|nr:septum formation family protein [Nitriliruptor alkaliphilus]
MLLLALALVGCTRGGSVLDRDGNVVGAGPIEVDELQAGYCLDVPPGTTGEVADVRVVPCEQEHTQEVFAVRPVEGDAFPGAGELAVLADTTCVDALQTDLGLTLADGLYFSYLLPTFDGWTNRSDRSIVCVLVRPTEGPVTGSIVADPARVPRKTPEPPVDPEPEDDEATDAVARAVLPGSEGEG